MAGNKGKERAVGSTTSGPQTRSATRRDDTEELSEPLSTPPRESVEPGDHLESDADSTVGNRLAEENARIEEIKQEIERRKIARKEDATRKRIRELEAAIEARQELERELADIREMDKEDSRAGIPGNKRQRINDTGEGSFTYPARDRLDAEIHMMAYQPNPKIEKLPPFKGKTIAEAQAFYKQAERRFLQDKGRNYPTDIDKILFCVSSFEPKIERRWTTYEEEVGLESITWAEFKDFLEDSIIDRDNRELNAARAYERAKQRDDQRIEDFVVYLDSLERELRITDDSLRRNTLYSKLNDQLQVEVDRKDDVPSTRKALIALCQRIQGKRTFQPRQHTSDSRGPRDPPAHPPVAGRQDGLPRQPPRPQGEYSSSANIRRQQFSDANRTPVGGPSGQYRSSFRCHRCNSTNHSGRNCPQVECYNCGKKGHISPYCTEPKKDTKPAGNGGARS